MSGAYDAGCIRVLAPDEANEKFAFARAADLAVRYPSVSPDFIARLVESCELAGFPLDAAARRYLDRDRSVPVTPELLECHRDLLSRLRP